MIINYLTPCFSTQGRDYIQSEACMYEVSMIISRGNLKKRIIPINVDDFGRECDDYLNISIFWDNEYKKKKLSERTVQIGNEKVQRDLYSAFLLMNSSLDLKGTNRDKCLETFDRFIQNHNSVIAEIINSNIKRPISFGL